LPLFFTVLKHAIFLQLFQSQGKRKQTDEMLCSLSHPVTTAFQDWKMGSVDKNVTQEVKII